jgi:hypothetical protein
MFATTSAFGFAPGGPLWWRRTLFDRRPDTMNVVMIIQRLEKFACLRLL